MRHRFLSLPRPLAILPLLLAASGCAVGPDYRRPAEPVAARFINAADATAAGGLDLAWWQGFDDPVLSGLIERAARNNTDVQQALARIREARAERNASAGAYYPSLSAGGSATRSRSTENGQIPFGQIPGAEIINTTYSASFDASWEIDLFGRIRRSVEAADARAAGREASARDALLSLAGDVAREYVELRLSQRRLAVQQDNQAIATETLRLTTLRSDAGEVADVDVQRAASNLHSISATRPQLLAQLGAGQYRLEQLLGEPPGALDEVLTTDSAAEAPLPQVREDLPPGLPSDMLRRRPDVAAAEATLAAATADIGVAVAEQYPQFSLTGQLGQESTSKHSFTAAASRIWAIGPQVSIPIFQGDQLASQVQARQAARDGALAAYRGAVLAALSDTETALLRDRRERERLGELVAATVTADIALRQQQLRYQAGDVALTEVLDAQRSRNSALDAELAAQATVAENRVALYKALGGGWSALETLATQTPVAVR